MSDAPSLALPTDRPSRATSYGLWTGVGLVVANMVGSGVLTTAGFMADTLGPLWILAAWAVGGAIALAGARVYAAMTEEIPGSGGEYRYLSRLVHPFAGVMAGWTSLLIGFSAPVAMAGLAAGAYFNVLFGVDAHFAGIAVVVTVTAAHAFHLRTSALAQDVLVGIKAVLLTAFVAFGLWMGSHEIPTWTPPAAPPTAGGTWAAFFNSLVFIGFCYSGWNAVVYVSDEFHHPKRDVRRAMAIGTLLVIGLYLAVNWVLVANLSPADLARVKTEDEKLTLGHVVLQHLLGETGAFAMSSVVLVALVSSLSAMTLVGPRVYSAMAGDGFLPRQLAARAGSPPLFSVLLQSGVAIFLMATQQFSVLLNNAGSILTLTSMIAVAALWMRMRARLSVMARVAAVVYVGASLWALVFSLIEAPSTLIWLATIAVLSAVGYQWTRERGAAVVGLQPTRAERALAARDAESRLQS